ncbi:synaptoporin [Aethina tumida]|uniref:synaptoporin n=1 Tax=Aethina tumida TaxID=116153 RepID=UPI00096B1D56|nr:synaptoporin [Aethina tumida]
MDLNFSAFQEPRGVMRILHFVFSICAFATITDYSGHVTVTCGNRSTNFEYGYPFQLHQNKTVAPNCTAAILGDFSSDAKFFVATGVLAMLYALAIAVVYAKFDNTYKTNSQWPLYDFILTVLFGVLWLSSSAAWANSLTGIKIATVPMYGSGCNCTSSQSSYSTLNISVVFGFLNFFLWAADLWFLYKETAWFPGNAQSVEAGN